MDHDLGRVALRPSRLDSPQLVLRPSPVSGGGIQGNQHIRHKAPGLRAREPNDSLELLRPVLATPKHAVCQAVPRIIVPHKLIAMDLGQDAVEDASAGVVKLDGPVAPPVAFPLRKDESGVEHAEAPELLAELRVR